jgi:Flp pilus assembly secretin CpaC
LATRRVESTIELGIGQSFVIGGLIDDRVNETFNKIPRLDSIPILGTLFKSKSESRNKTELIVMVTPEFVEPMTSGDSKLTPTMPGEFLRPMMLPNGMPGSSNVGTGATSTKGAPVTTKKDAWKRVTPPSGK